MRFFPTSKNQRTAPLQTKECGTRAQPHFNHYSMIYTSGIMRQFAASQERKREIED
jgi:hypothetical protein